MRTAFVTGGAGYLGSHLAKALKQAGYYTFCFDLKLPENRKYWDNQTIGDVRVEHDLYDSFEYLQRVHNKKPDVVFHLAGLIEVGLSVENPIDFWQTNVGGTCNLLHIMKEFHVNNIVYSSTAGLYRPQFTSLSEKAEIGSNNPYANSKYAAECAIRDSKLNHIIFRFFNLAGADPDNEMGESHEPETHLIPRILQNLNNFTVYGNDYNTPDGTCVRDFVHVSDVADAHLSAAEYLARNGSSQVINLGTGKGYSVKEIIALVKEVTGQRVIFSYEPRRAGDPPYLFANINFASDLLQYRPKHDIISIIRTAYNWETRDRDE